MGNVGAGAGRFLPLFWKISLQADFSTPEMESFVFSDKFFFLSSPLALSIVLSTSYLFF